MNSQDPHLAGRTSQPKAEDGVRPNAYLRKTKPSRTKDSPNQLKAMIRKSKIELNEIPNPIQIIYIDSPPYSAVVKGQSYSKVVSNENL